VRTWAQWEHAYSSELLRVEVLRTIDRNRLRNALTDREVAELATKRMPFLTRLSLSR